MTFKEWGNYRKLVAEEAAMDMYADWKSERNKLIGALKVLMREMPVGRLWCSVCESWDHNCGCNPSIGARTKWDICEKARAVLAEVKGGE